MDFNTYDLMKLYMLITALLQSYSPTDAVYCYRCVSSRSMDCQTPTDLAKTLSDYLAKEVTTTMRTRSNYITRRLRINGTAVLGGGDGGQVDSATTDATIEDVIVRCKGTTCMTQTVQQPNGDLITIHSCDITDGKSGGCKTIGDLTSGTSSVVCTCSGDLCNNAQLSVNRPCKMSTILIPMAAVLAFVYVAVGG